MRRGPLSSVLALSILLSALPARAEEFDLLSFLRPRPSNEVPLPEDASAPLPPHRPVVSDVVLTPVSIAADGVAQAAPLPSVPLPLRRPKITLEPTQLLLLQYPASALKAEAALQASAPAAAQAGAVPEAAPAPVAAPAVAPVVAVPVAAPLATVAPVAAEPVEAATVPTPAPAAAPPAQDVPVAVAAADPSEPLVPPVGRRVIPLPEPRPVTAPTTGLKPIQVRTIAISPNRPAPVPAPVAVAAVAPTVEKAPPAAPAPVLAAAPTVVVAAAPAPAPAPAPGRIVDLALDPVRSEASELPPIQREMPTPVTSDALSPAVSLAGAVGQTNGAAPTARKEKAPEDALGPVLPPDPAMVADAMLQRIPTVTSAIVGLVSAVSPGSANASEPAKSAAAAPSAPYTPPPVPTDVTTVERKSIGPAPYEMVRRLQRLQDLIAAGDTNALQSQRALITEIEAQFRATDPEVWQDPRNGRAAVIFFLSGGGPDELRNLLKLKPLPAVDERLLRGALAYVEGREDDAERYLGEIDALRLPDALGGQIALAQAAVTVRKDPRKAMAMLDVARLLMPGTLVEEAALRREILVAAQIGDVNQFEQLSRQYLFRFRYSVYAGNFRQRFAAALTRMAFLNDPTQFPRLTALLQPLDRDSRVEVYLMVARGALNQGKLVAATLAAERVLAEAQPVSSDFERARVYRGAVRAASSKDVDAALADLRTAVRTRLPPDDVMLLDAAITTAELVKSAGETTRVAATAPTKVDPMKLTATTGAPALLPRLPAAPEQRVAAAAPPPPPPPAPKAEDAPPQNAVENRARGALDKIDALLKEAPR